MINCHRSIGSESHNICVLALRTGQVPCPAVTLAFITVVSPQMFHARYSEQRTDVSTHFPEAALGRKGKKCHVTSFCVFLFSSFPCRPGTHAQSCMFRRGLDFSSSFLL